MTKKDMVFAVAAVCLWLVSYITSIPACFAPGCGNGNWFTAVSILTLLAACVTTAGGFIQWLDAQPR